MVPEPPAEPVFDAARLEDVAGDDVEFRCHVLGEFLDMAPKLLADIDASAAAADAAALTAASHSLKGSARALGADAFGSACATLEMLGRGGLLDATRAAVARARDEFARLEPVLRAYLASPGPDEAA